MHFRERGSLLNSIILMNSKVVGHRQSTFKSGGANDHSPPWFRRPWPRILSIVPLYRVVKMVVIEMLLGFLGSEAGVQGPGEVLC